MCYQFAIGAYFYFHPKRNISVCSRSFHKILFPFICPIMFIRLTKSLFHQLDLYILSRMKF